jgi:hypothetical protein
MLHSSGGTWVDRASGRLEGSCAGRRTGRTGRGPRALEALVADVLGPYRVQRSAHPRRVLPARVDVRRPPQFGGADGWSARGGAAPGVASLCGGLAVDWRPERRGLAERPVGGLGRLRARWMTPASQGGTARSEYNACTRARSVRPPTASWACKSTPSAVCLVPDQLAAVPPRALGRRSAAAGCYLHEQVRHRPKWQLVLDILDAPAGWELCPPVLVAEISPRRDRRVARRAGRSSGAHMSCRSRPKPAYRSRCWRSVL